MLFEVTLLVFIRPLKLTQRKNDRSHRFSQLPGSVQSLFGELR